MTAADLWARLTLCDCVRQYRVGGSRLLRLPTPIQGQQESDIMRKLLIVGLFVNAALLTGN